MDVVLMLSVRELIGLGLLGICGVLLIVIITVGALGKWENNTKDKE